MLRRIIVSHCDFGAKVRHNWEWYSLEIGLALKGLAPPRTGLVHPFAAVPFIDVRGKKPVEVIAGRGIT